MRATKRARLGSEGHALLLDHQRLRARCPSHPRDRISPATICWARQGFSVLLFLDAPRGSPLRLHLRTGIRTEGFKLGCVCMLFLTGYVFGRSTGHRPLLLGCVMVLAGVLLTGVAIALGG
ncbi:MAG: hypothetical protein WCC08_21340 [Terrimicrobiaceae bacterium]